MPDQSYIAKLINCEAIKIHPLPLPAFQAANISVDVLRLDLIHPVISGNKYFKLKVPVANALQEGAQGIVSFGGAYSNHLVALAYLCNAIQLDCVGIIRGEQSSTLSPTLQDAIRSGMKPVFISRTQYADKESLNRLLKDQFPRFKVIPEGGQSAEGVSGSKEILNLVNAYGYDVISCAVGTGTMMAGIIAASADQQHVLGISALKLPPENDVSDFIRLHSGGKSFEINYDYHFGGYAKKTDQLIDFMNQLWDNYQLPTDFVYTAKLIFGINQLASENRFAAGNRLLIIHSGGLQGNRSLSHRLHYP